MEELVRKGLCKAIGISNFTSTKVKNLLETAEIIPATNQGTYCEALVNEPRNRHSIQNVDCDKPAAHIVSVTYMTESLHYIHFFFVLHSGITSVPTSTRIKKVL